MFYYILVNKEKISIEIHAVEHDSEYNLFINPELDKINNYINPIEAANAAIKIRDLYPESEKIKFSIIKDLDSEEFVCILKTKLQYKLQNWADSEFKKLKKCLNCPTILSSKEDSYCSLECSKKYLFQEEEHEFYI